MPRSYPFATACFAAASASGSVAKARGVPRNMLRGNWSRTTMRARQSRGCDSQSSLRDSSSYSARKRVRISPSNAAFFSNQRFASWPNQKRNTSGAKLVIASRIMPNRLADQTSPYLLQHAENPVDWHPWGEEAFARARDEAKPILLSIGYSACHWCHVMAHESFEDEGVAAVMNRLFINVKVDREERPDLDQIYQSAHQMLAQRAGGWPLTMFLSPDGTPFFGGTYFPKAARHGMPAFAELCERVAGIWREKRAEIAAQDAEVVRALGRTLPRPALRPPALSSAAID